MCVSQTRSSLLSRSGFLGAVSAAALPLFAEPARALAAVQDLAGKQATLAIPAGLSPANERAARIASTSPYIRAHVAQITELAASIGDATLRADVLDLLVRPIPRYLQRYPDAASRAAMRDAMAFAGFIAPDAPVAGVFPPMSQALGYAQPFWSAPGSDTNGHHSYPGGLCVHELFNARMGEQFTRVYDLQYFNGRSAVDRDLAIAAALYHDIMKTMVFQYNADGTFFDELLIGDTGGHHVLSGAEAIARGRDARFVTVLLSAHAAPSLGDQAKVVTWCRAAAMLAGVDPVEYGLVRKTNDGYALATLPVIECFVNHLSDHDYVLAIDATHHVRPMLATVAPRFGIDPHDVGALNWWRLRVCSHVTEIALYYELTRSEKAFVAAVEAAHLPA
ncbi:MAG: HDIG domain-containing metalloprotein [Vulcanimicrobiaceae bacterium]